MWQEIGLFEASTVHMEEVRGPLRPGRPKAGWFDESHEDTSNGGPVEEAERTVQQFLRVGLAARFNWCTIRAEQAGKLGRTDLEVVDDRTGVQGVITHHALLELKVLRSFTHTGSPYPVSNAEEAISKGVNQANSYGNANNSLLRMLCC